MALEQIYTGISTNIDTKGLRIFQSAPYIEDGWYIVERNGFEVWEIPMGGGYEQLMETCPTFDEAIKLTKTLT